MITAELKAALAHDVTPQSLLEEGACERFLVDGERPSLVVRPQSTPEVQAVLRWANAHHIALIPWGGGTEIHVGFPPDPYDVALDTSLLNRIVDYPADDLTITVGAGLTLGELQKVLSSHGQVLPVHPPNPGRATLGGLIATDASGPKRFSEGTMRDLVLGLQVVQADGSLIRTGARVVKNAAGYDLGKLHTGAFGTLGVIVEATLRLRPIPEVLCSVWCGLDAPSDAEAALAALLDSDLAPVSLDYMNAAAARGIDAEDDLHGSTDGPALLVGLDGFREDVEWQVRQMAAILGYPQAQQAFLLSDVQRERVSERVCQFRAVPDAYLVAKACVPSSQVTSVIDEAEQAGRSHGLTAEAMAHAGNGIIYLRVRQEVTEAAALAAVQAWRELAGSRGGTLLIERAPRAVKEKADVWGPPRSDFRLMQAVKQQFDPNRILCPGRFIGRDYRATRNVTSSPRGEAVPPSSMPFSPTL